MAKKNIATFLGPNKGLSISGEYAFAYNGGDVAGTELTLLEFTTGKYTLVGSWQGYYYESPYGEDFRFVLYLNGAKVEAFTTEASIRGTSRSLLEVIIPPLTRVKITSENVTDTTAREMLTSLTCRIYDA